MLAGWGSSEDTLSSARGGRGGAGGIRRLREEPAGVLPGTGTVSCGVYSWLLCCIGSGAVIKERM